jgi:hypothetical protein
VKNSFIELTFRKNVSLSARNLYPGLSLLKSHGRESRPKKSRAWVQTQKVTGVSPDPKSHGRESRSKKSRAWVQTQKVTGVSPDPKSHGRESRPKKSRAWVQTQKVTGVTPYLKTISDKNFHMFWPNYTPYLGIVKYFWLK